MACRMWKELSRAEFETLSRKDTVAVLPIGSIEQHGPHLPVGTDSLIVGAVVKGVAQRLQDVECIFLPTVWCSKSNEHIEFVGTVLLTLDTFTNVLKDISASVARANFRKLVFMNAHGGNTDILRGLIRDIRQDTGLLTFDLELAPYYKIAPEVYDIHAGCFETSVILARYPALMEGRDFQGLGSDLDRGKVAASFDGFKYLRPEGRPVTVAWLTTDYTNDGVIGDPTDANVEDGQRRFEMLVDVVCDILREVAAFEYRS